MIVLSHLPDLSSIFLNRLITPTVLVPGLAPSAQKTPR